jgi:hypothetical protein
LTGTLTTASQPNITAVGTLSGLTSTGVVDLTGASNVSLGAVGTVQITGGSLGQFIQTDGSGTLSFASASAPSQPGTDFNTTLTAADNYAVTSTMANGAVFSSNVIVYSMYVTNIDATGSNAAAISASLRAANGTIVNLANQIPVPYRGAVELFKQPKYFATGDALQFQGFNSGTGANSFFHATVTYQAVTDTSYQYAATNIATASTATDVYTSTGAASVIQSVMLTNSGALGNIAVTVTVVNSSNVVQGYMTYELLIPVNSTIELCEQPRRIGSGDKIQVTASGADTITATVAARRI